MYPQREEGEGTNSPPPPPVTLSTSKNCVLQFEVAVCIQSKTKASIRQHKKLTRVTGRSPDHSLPILPLADGLHQALHNRKRTSHLLIMGQAVLHARRDPPCSLYTTHVCPHHMKPWARTRHS